jgi:hypothetical protein
MVLVIRASHEGVQTALLSWASKILGPNFFLNILNEEIEYILKMRRCFKLCRYSVVVHVCFGMSQVNGSTPRTNLYFASLLLLLLCFFS